MRKRLVTLLLGSVLCLALLAAEGQTGTGDTLPAVGQIAFGSPLPFTLPFDRWNGVLVIRAGVGESLPERAVLATGLPLCLMVPAYATKARIPTEKGRDMPLMDRTVRVNGVRPLMLRMDRTTLVNVPFGVFDPLSRLSSKKLADAPALWLGTSALAAFTLTIDPQKQSVTFRTPGEPLPEKSMVVPFEIKEGRIILQARLNGKTFPALLDTAAVGAMIPSRLAEELNLPAITTLTAALPNGKEGKVAVVRLDELALGEAKVTGVQALYVADTRPGGFDPELGLIGTDVLLRYRVTIDYQHRRLALESLPEETRPSPTPAAPPKEPPARPQP